MCFELACQLHTLKQQIAEYMIEEAMKQQQRQDESEIIDERAEMLLNPDTGFAERFDAVMTDMLAGKHISQTEPKDPGRYRKLADDNEEQ